MTTTPLEVSTTSGVGPIGAFSSDTIDSTSTVVLVPMLLTSRALAVRVLSEGGCSEREVWSLLKVRHRLGLKASPRLSETLGQGLARRNCAVHPMMLLVRDSRSFFKTF